MGFNLCGRPSGKSIFIPIIFTTSAFFLSNRASRWCDFLFRQSETSGEIKLVTAADNIFAFSRSLGPQGYDGIVNGGSGILPYCYAFPESFISNELDRKWRAAMIFPIIVTIIGGIIMIFTWFSPCMGISHKWWRFMGTCLLLTCLCEGMTFLMLASDVCNADYKSASGWTSTPSCSLSRGGNMAVAAMLFWFISALSIFRIPAPENSHKDERTTETVQPVGTKVIETKTEIIVDP